MTGLVVAESIKLSKRWVFRVMVLVFVALCALTGFVLLILPEIAPEAIEGIPVLGRRDALILGIQTVLGQTWFPMILAVIMLGSEVTTSTWGSSLTREARRGRHVTAKLGVMTIATWITAVIVIGAWVAFAVVVTEGSSGFSGADWFGVGWKTGVVQLTWVALGLAAIAWVRSTGLAIGIVVAFSFGEGILALWSAFRSVSLSAATNALFGEISADISGGFGVGFAGSMSFTRAVVVVLAWALVGTLAAYAGLRLRDA
jgi:small basic protein